VKIRLMAGVYIGLNGGLIKGVLESDYYCK